MIGAGRMATALGCGFVKAGLVPASSIVASDPSGDARAAFERAVPGAVVIETNQHVVERAEVVLLAVKPQKMGEALASIREYVRPEALVLSIAAGITLDKLAAGLPHGQRIVRIMPNTPCLISRGASAYSLGPHSTETDGQFVGRLMSAVGAAFLVSETLLDVVTGLSGSGPAFVYTMIEALTAGAMSEGMPAELAAELSARTALGAAEMVLQTGQSPDALRNQVTSPGGTTLAGLAVLKERGFSDAVTAAVRAATRRSIELGQLN